MYQLALRVLAVGCIAPALFHLIFGVGGDWLIGVAPSAPADPSLDSQNRFYGAIFAGYGAAYWWAAADVRRNQGLIKLLLAAMLLGAVGRGWAIYLSGWPSPMVQLLWASECLIPPVMWLWLNRYLPR
jgi:hypothetical protein